MKAEPQRPEAGTHLVGLVVGHQFVDGRGLGDLQEHGLRLLPPLGRSGAHVAQVAGARALALAGAFHAHPRRHALGTSVQQTGDVGRVGQGPGLFVPLLRLLRGGVTCNTHLDESCDIKAAEQLDAELSDGTQRQERGQKRRPTFVPS